MHPRAPASIRNRSAGDLAPTRAPDRASARYHPCPPVNEPPQAQSDFLEGVCGRVMLDTGRFERLLGKGSRSRSSTQRSTFLPGSFDRSSSSASSSPLAVQVRSSFEPRVEPFPHCVLCLAPSSLPCPQQRGANLTIPARVCAQEAASASIMSIPNGRIHLGPPTGAPPRPRGLAP